MLELFNYNFMAAFALCAVLYVIGEWVCVATKAWVPSIFVTACLMLLAYWNGLPHDVVTDATLLPFGATAGIFLLIVHMGTLFNFKQLMAQWKVVVVALSGLVGLCVVGFFVCPLFIDRAYVIAGLPPLSGGIVAASMMKTAADAAAKSATDPAVAATFTAAGVYAIAMYCVQGFVGYPLTAVFLQNEGRRLINDYRAGKTVTTTDAKAEGTTTRRKLIPPMPKKYDSAVVILLKLGIVAYLATVCGSISFGPIGKISGAIWCLFLGIIFTELGFLDTNSLVKANSAGFIMFALMMFVLDGLKDCTPQMLVTILTPLAVVIVIGVTAMLIFAYVMARIVKLSVPLALSATLTALYGFPPNAVLTESVCKALAQNDDEMNYLSSIMMPAMIVGGFVTVTISSVFIAGIFMKLF